MVLTSALIFLISQSTEFYTFESKECWPDSDGSCYVFPAATSNRYYNQISTKTGDALCCFSNDKSVDLQTCWVSGCQGSWCFRVLDDAPEFSTVHPDLSDDAKQQITKVCSSTKLTNGVTANIACKVNSDCASGTCVAVDSAKSQTLGQMLICEPIGPSVTLFRSISKNYTPLDQKTADAGVYTKDSGVSVKDAEVGGAK